jgi:hypothetical protein
MDRATHQMPQQHQLGAVERGLLARLAAKYIWWKTPDEALRIPERVIAQVMNIGDYDDVQEMVQALGDETLSDVLRSAEAGMFNERSWTYWHYRLGLAAPGQVPPLPSRRLPL